jgi:hypothetical protein
MLPNSRNRGARRQRRAVVLSAAVLIATGSAMPRHSAGGSALANSPKTATPIEHLIVVIGENRSFDHVYATYVPKRGNVIRPLPSSNLLPQGCTWSSHVFGRRNPRTTRLWSVAGRETGRLRRANLPGRGRPRARWSQRFRRTSRGIRWLAGGLAGGIGAISPNPGEQLLRRCVWARARFLTPAVGNTAASVALL